MISDSRESARRGWRRRLFAWLHFQSDGGNYDAFVAPYKHKLFGDISGTVLEIGAGTGENFAFYPPGIEWCGVEPNFYMQEYLLKRAHDSGIEGTLRSGVAEKLPVEDAGVDVVVSTLVMCSVSDQAAALREILRVLRPGGRFLFIEHVAAPAGSGLRRAQRAIKPAWKLAADGCHPDRETDAAIQNAGFSHVEIEHFHAPLPIASPHIAGTAVK